MGDVLANHIDNVAATKSPSNASFPASADTFNANDDAYLARLPELDEAIQAVAATIPEENRQLYSYHNSFSYFTRRYGYTVLGSVQPHDFS